MENNVLAVDTSLMQFSCSASPIHKNAHSSCYLFETYISSHIGLPVQHVSSMISSCIVDSSLQFRGIRHFEGEELLM